MRILRLLVFLVGFSLVFQHGFAFPPKTTNSPALAVADDSGCDWPSFGRSPDNNRVAPAGCGPISNKPVKLWEYRTSAIVEASPVVYKNNVFCGSGEAMLCLDLSSGLQKWSFDTHLSSWTPTVWDNKVYFGSHYSVFCINMINGSLEWELKTESYIQSAPVIADGMLYVGSCDNHLYCIDAPTGQLLWKFKTEKSVVSNPMVVNDKLYFNSENTLYCLDTKSCDIVWKKRVCAQLFNSPVFYNNKIFFGSLEGYLYCFEAQSGNLTWKIEVGEGVIGMPVIWNNCVYFGSTDGLVFCADIETSQIKWVFSVGGTPTSPAICDDKVYFGSMDNYFYCLEAKDGKLLWAYKTNHAIWSSPSISNNKIVFASYDNNIYCFGDGNTLLGRDVPVKIDIFTGYPSSYQVEVDICSTKKIQAHVLNTYNEVLDGYKLEWSIDPEYATIENGVLTPLGLGTVELKCCGAGLIASRIVNIYSDNQPIDYLFFDVVPGAKSTEILHLYNNKKEKLKIHLSSSISNVTIQPETVEIDPQKGANIDVTFFSVDISSIEDDVFTIQLEYYIDNQKLDCDKEIECFISPVE